MKLSDPADKTLDAAADGNFGGKQGVNRRAGYGDRLEMALRFAKKGACLSAGEGQLIVEHYEDEIVRLREENQTLHSRILSGSLEDRSAIHQLQDINLRHQEVNDRLRRILAALREPSLEIRDAVMAALNNRAVTDPIIGEDIDEIIEAAVAAAEKEAQ